LFTSFFHGTQPGFPSAFCPRPYRRDSAPLGWLRLAAEAPALHGLLTVVVGALLADAAVMFAVRIVTADFYLAAPIKDLDVCYSEFRESGVKKVPVVRIFGATPAGEPPLVCVSCVFFFCTSLFK